MTLTDSAEGSLHDRLCGIEQNPDRGAFVRYSPAFGEQYPADRKIFAFSTNCLIRRTTNLESDGVYYFVTEFNCQDQHSPTRLEGNELLRWLTSQNRS